MRNWWLCIGLLIVLGAAPFKSFAQDSLQEDLQSTFQVELKQLRSFAKLTEAESTAVVDQTSDIFLEAAKSDTRFRSANAYDENQIPPFLFEKIAPVLRKHVADQAGVKAYLDDWAKRQQFGREGAIAHLITTLDRASGLTAAQIAQLKELAAQMVHEGRLPIPSITDSTAFAQVELVLSDLEDKILTKEQVTHWVTNGDEALRRTSEFDANTSQSEETRKQKLTNAFQSFADARITQMAADLNLPAEQIRKLRVAAKGAYHALVRERMEAEDWYQARIDRGQTPSPNSHTSRLARSSRLSLFSSYSRWKPLVRATLTDEQWKQLDKIYDEQYRLGRCRTATSMMLSMCRGLELSGSQQLKLREVFMQSISPRSGKRRNLSQMYSQYTKLLAMPDEDYIAIIGEANWLEFEQSLDSYREYFAREDEPDENDDELPDN